MSAVLRKGSHQSVFERSLNHDSTRQKAPVVLAVVLKSYRRGGLQERKEPVVRANLISILKLHSTKRQVRRTLGLPRCIFFRWGATQSALGPSSIAAINNCKNTKSIIHCLTEHCAATR